MTFLTLVTIIIDIILAINVAALVGILLCPKENRAQEFPINIPKQKKRRNIKREWKPTTHRYPTRFQAKRQAMLANACE